jgi:hypothetical protein
MVSVLAHRFLYHHPIMSDPDQPSESGRTNAPLYGSRGIIIGTILGSLAAGVLMVSLNYLALGRANLAKSVGLAGIAVFLAFLGVTFLVPQTLGVALLLSAVQAFIAYFLVDRLQGEAITYHIAHGGPMHSSLRAALVGFLTGTTLFFALVMIAALYMTVTGQVPEAAQPAPVP